MTSTHHIEYQAACFWILLEKFSELWNRATRFDHIKEEKIRFAFINWHIVCAYTRRRNANEQTHEWSVEKKTERESQI